MRPYLVNLFHILMYNIFNFHLYSVGQHLILRNRDVMFFQFFSKGKTDRRKGGDCHG